MATETTYICLERWALSVGERRIGIAEGTIRRLLKDYHFRGLESDHGPIAIHWFREKTVQDRAVERATGLDWESVTDRSGRYLTGFYKAGDGSLIHLRADIPIEDVARVVIHELAHAEAACSPSGAKSASISAFEDDEAWAQGREIALQSYHRGVVW